MKKITFQPGFELVWALSIMIIMALPYVVTAQDHKEFKIDINNGDTTINGKNIKSLSTGERTDAVKKLRELSRDVIVDMPGADRKQSMFMRRGMGRDTGMMHGNKMWRPMAAAEFKRHDSIGRGGDMVRNRMMMHNEGDHQHGDGARAFGREDFAGNRRHEHGQMGMGMHGGDRFDHRRNTENFSFSNVDKDGISTHITYRVSDADPRNAKKITGTEKPDLTIEEVTLTPMFATGKTVLSMSLTAKTSADIEFKDTEGAVLWAGKAIGGELIKSFELPKNGVYYLQVQQAGKLALRKIIKQE